MKYDLSILIPARNEMWLGKTIENLLENSSQRTEIITVIDGEGNIEDIPQDPRVTVIYLQKSVGQRAATNMACKLSKARYVAKTDAHIAVDKDFDTILMADMQDDCVVAPLMRNLHAFDWVCENGHRRYQGPSGPCLECKLPTKRDVLWFAKPSPKSRSYCFDSEPHFQYFGEWMKRPHVKAQGAINETMSLQGSFFMCTRKKYWELDISSEKQFTSWGSQGIEVACKFALTGGKVLTNAKTWYAHLFRTQGGDFGFPYKQDHSKSVATRQKAKEIFFQGTWKKQVYPLSMMLEKFWPIVCSGRGWSNEEYLKQKAEELKNNRSGIASIEHRPTGKYWVLGCDNIRTKCLEIEGLLNEGKHPHQELQELWTNNKGDFWWHVERFCRKDQVQHYEQQYIDKILGGTFKPHPHIAYEPPLTKGILYYTDGELDEKIAKPVRDQIKKSGLPITAVSLRPIDFGNTNIHFKGKRGALTMARQILAGLEAMKEDVVMMAEHDIFYSLSHWQGQPTGKDKIMYNLNVYKINMEKMYGLKVDDCRQLSGMCAYRETLLNHYRKRVKMLEDGISATRMGYEPGTHGRAERVDDLKSETWKSYEPILDLRTGHNLTKTKWRQEDFRNQRYTEGWTETSLIPSHGDVKEFLTKQGMI